MIKHVYWRSYIYNYYDWAFIVKQYPFFLSSFLKSKFVNFEMFPLSKLAFSRTTFNYCNKTEMNIEWTEALMDRSLKKLINAPLSAHCSHELLKDDCGYRLNAILVKNLLWKDDHQLLLILKQTLTNKIILFQKELWAVKIFAQKILSILQW